MTRQDYKLVAHVLSLCGNRIPKQQLIRRLSGAFVMEDPKFNAGKFVEACYGGSKLLKEAEKHSEQALSG